jgi:T4-like virus Myoviridae tail sheath stabiliser
MLNGQTYYHGAIRKTIVAFGRLFSDIKIARQGNDGAVAQTIAVPLAYAPKEKWLVRVDSDPSLNHHTYTSLPRLSFEITGYSYDSTRKTNKMKQITCTDNTSTETPVKKSVFAPAPYNISISLYVLTKTQEDAMQIVEQILPIFNPEYTLSVNAVPEMEIVQDIPVILNSITVEDNYDGSFQERRFVVHTLTFTLKTNIYGPVTEGGVILTSMANLSIPGRKYTATATAPADPVTENWEAQF